LPFLPSAELFMHLTAGQLREILLNEFTESEVEALCVKLGIEYTRLSGTGLFGKTRELLAIVHKQDRISHLRTHMRAMRPNAFDAYQDADDDSEAADDPDDAVTQRTERTAAPLSNETSPRTRNRMIIASDTDDDGYSDDQTDDADVVDRRRVGNDHDDDDGLDEDDIVDPETVRQRPGSERRVSRETTRAYEIVPQTRGLVPLLIAGAVIVFAALIVFLPSMLRGDAAASSVAAPTDAPPQATATSSIPIIGEAAGAPVIPTPQPAQENPAGVVVIATPAPISDAGAPAAPPNPNVIPTVPVIATPQAAPATTGENHPAARLVQDANTALPAYFKGQTGADTVAAYWTGKAYDITVAWNAALPKAVKLGNAARSTLTIDFEFVRPPTVTDSRADRHTVSTREYWAYRNPATNTNLCDTRDYTYTVREIDGQFLIETVTSKVVNKLCR
jgi:hypothetical protein